jgi:CheY-like chemotaxis protein
MIKKLKVLVVEDERLTARCICEDLKDLGVEALEPVSTGEKAIEIALKENPDLILMDIRLAGGMDGIEAAVQIHKSKKVPIVFMSGFITEYVIKQVKDLDYMAFFEKPVTVDILKPVINQLYM